MDYTKEIEAPRMPKQVVFISHSSDETAVAIKFKSTLEFLFEDKIKIFVSSDFKSIPGGDNWFLAILNALKTSQVVLALLSRDSVDRPWINFEAGVGCGAVAHVIPIAIGDLDRGEIQPPLGPLQARGLTDPEDVNGIFNDVEAFTGTRRLRDFNVEAFQREIEDAIKSIPVRDVILQPTIEVDGSNYVLEFSLVHKGNRDVKLIELWAAVPANLLVGSFASGHTPPVLVVDENEQIDGKRHCRKTYKVTDAEIPIAFDKMIERLPNTFSASQSPARCHLSLSSASRVI
jgi:hypothetical protein